MFDSGEFLYYISVGVPYSIEVMKNEARRLLEDPEAVITIQHVQEITMEQWELIAKRPFHL